MEHGRWASVGSARTYINEAAAEEAAISATDEGKRRLRDAVGLSMGLLRREFGVK